MDPHSTWEYSFLKIKQSYYLGDVRKDITLDFNNNYLPTDETTDHLSPIDVKYGWFPYKDVRIAYKTDYDTYAHEFIRHGVETSYKNERGDIFDFDYQYDNILSVQQINLHAKSWLWSNIKGEILLSQSLSSSIVNEQDVALTYQALCWSVQILSTHTPTDKGLYLVFNLSNISSPMGLSL